MNFGVPNQRRMTTKVEKYPNTAVATLAIAEKGKGRKIYFNEKAATLLGLPEEDATVAFSFDNGIWITNGNNPNIPEEVKLHISKSIPRRLSDKKTFDYIIKTNDLNDQMENEFQLVERVIDGITGFDWQLMQTTGEQELYEAQAVMPDDAFPGSDMG